MESDAYTEIVPFYDCEHAAFGEDVDFYLQAAQSPVLEIGAGTGRILEPLAMAGFEVWGIEPSSAMLARARERLAGNPRVRLIQGSVEELALDQCFATVIFPLNTLWHLPDLGTQTAALVAARNHLQSGGHVIIDVSNPLTMADRGADGTVRQRFSGVCEGREVIGVSAAWDDQGEQRLRLALRYEWVEGDTVHRRATELRLRYIYRYELELMLREAGLKLRNVFGWYDLSPFGAAAPNMIMIAARS